MKCFQGVIRTNCDMILKQWLNNWFEIYKKNALREQTQSTYKMLIKTIIEPKIGNLKLNEIKPIYIQNFINELNNYSTATIIKIKEYFKSSI